MPDTEDERPVERPTGGAFAAYGTQPADPRKGYPMSQPQQHREDCVSWIVETLNLTPWSSEAEHGVQRAIARRIMEQNFGVAWRLLQATRAEIEAAEKLGKPAAV